MVIENITLALQDSHYPRSNHQMQFMNNHIPVNQPGARLSGRESNNPIAFPPASRMNKMNRRIAGVLGVGALLATLGLFPAGSDAIAAPQSGRSVVVNSLGDEVQTGRGTMTLRAALATVRAGGVVTFDRALDGGTISLAAIGSEHTILPGEIYQGNVFAGFADRDYGRSALYVAKDVTIDAGALPHGITLEWAGPLETPARVLAVYGNLKLNKVTIRGGRSVAEPITGGSQAYTLARGGGLATWGTATLTGCTIGGNSVEGDLVPSRDRGAFGGGIFGNRLLLTNCIVAGNAVTGFGGAGGGVYSVGGAGMTGFGSSLTRCAITGNRVIGEHAYGGGVFSGGGGAGASEILTLCNCTIARNAAMDNEAVAESPMTQYYYRGGGVYMSNGGLAISSCTIVENAVAGHPAMFNGKSNMGGGGVAATIGNAHVVTQIELRHSIVAGNSLNGADDDIFTGSLLEFTSYGFNRVGRLDFSQMLVPVPAWMWLSRRHWPKAGDLDGVRLADVVDLDAVAYHDSLKSVGVDDGGNAVLAYPPAGDAVDAIPNRPYLTAIVYAGYTATAGTTNGFLDAVLLKLRTDCAAELGSDFGSDFGDLSQVTFTPIANTWPADPLNAPWIAFWHSLDDAIAGRLGTAGLNDDFWQSFDVPVSETGVSYHAVSVVRWIHLAKEDQAGLLRPSGRGSDIGAIESRSKRSSHHR
jgi:hypothetical protein